MVSRFSPCLPTGAHPLHTPLCGKHLFLVGCCVSRCRSAAVQRQRRVSFFYFFAAWFATPKTIIRHPPHTFRPDPVSSIMIPSPLTPTFGWLLHLTSKRQPPKAETPSLSLFIDGSRFGAPSKGTSRGDRKPTTRCLLWNHGESRHQDFGAPLPHLWRERAKPLEGRVAAAHFGCCVLWRGEIVPQNRTSNHTQNLLKNCNFWGGFGYD